jgi:penicillin-binding protein 1A
MSRIIKIIIFVLFLPSLCGVSFGYSLINFLELPDIKQLYTNEPKSATRLYADQGELFAELFVEKRVPISLNDMPIHLRNAFIAIEDVRFYQHSGFDLRGIARAFYRNVVRQGLSEGASTITQQLARNLYLTQEKTLKRKIEELILAINIERNYSKEEILHMYLNLIYLGEGAYGVEAASYTYFDKRAKDLTLPEAATLASLTRAPSRSSPFKNAKKTFERRNLVLDKMYQAGFIDRDTCARAMATKLTVAPFKAHEKKTAYFVEHTKQTLDDYLPENEHVSTHGLNVKTSISLKMTEYAYEAIDRGLRLYKERNPKTTTLPEAALIALEVKTGEIKVLIGGKDFVNSSYNRATQAKRQPGSAFKPIIYLAALNQGFSPNTMLRDAPMSYSDSNGQTWEPRNYNNEYHGDVTMRRALELSLNTATVRLLERVGVQNVRQLAKHLHITTNLAPNLSLALGSGEVTPLDLAAAYATIARYGVYLPPKVIKTVLTNQGEEIHRDVDEEQVIPPEHAYTLIDMMKGVIKRGTATKAASMPYFLAGKTGTTNEFRDAWFVGFSPELLCLVWVGYDRDAFLGRKESGATAALPIWMDFMSKALPLYPNEDFAKPQNDSFLKRVLSPIVGAPDSQESTGPQGPQREVTSPEKDQSHPSPGQGYAPFR